MPSATADQTELDRIPSSQPIGKPVVLLQTNEKVLKNFQ
jgi:hypothetical protein